MYRPAHDARLTRLAPAARDAATVRWLPPLLLLGVVLDDAFLMPRAPSFAVLGLLDEPAHLATSLVLLAAITAMAGWRGARPPAAFAAGLVLAGNLMDVDHVPEVLGSDALTAGTPRPYSHSLLTVVILTAVSLTARRSGRRRGSAVAAGAAVGVAGHLLRDLGTAPVALLWPVSDRGLTIPHSAYLAVLALATVVACWWPRHPDL